MNRSCPKLVTGRRLRRLLAAVAVSLAGIALAGFGASRVSRGLEVAQPAFPRQGAASRSLDDAITGEFSRFALNALLAPLLDDDEPPRWSDVALSHICGPAAHVEINGKPLAHGTRIPTTPFTMRWSMDQCSQLEAFELNGTVELLVFQEESSLSAIVNAERLIVSSVKGTARMGAPFASRLSLLSAKSRP